jgi:hypothetical protein
VIARAGDLCADLVAYLRADLGLAALISDRLYHRVLPKDRLLPAVTYKVQVIAPDRCGARGGPQPYILFEAWSYTRPLSRLIAEQLRAALECYGHALARVLPFSLVSADSERFKPGPMQVVYRAPVCARIDFREIPLTAQELAAMMPEPPPADASEEYSADQLELLEL